MLKKIAFVFAVAALVVGVGAGSAQAYTFNTDLTLGSTGADVVALQGILVSGGYLTMPAGVPMGYFGALTQAAVAKWQAASGIAPAAGYVGPISRGRLNGAVVPGPSGLPVGCTSTAGYSSITGAKCDSGSSLPAGCSSTAGYSPITGAKCDGGSTSSTGPLAGGAGSIDSFEEMSNYSNEQVGEGEEDVEIAGIEIEADSGSDIEITAARIDFSTQPGNDDLDEFITEVSVWFDGEEVARVDANEFNDDNDWTKTVTLDSGAVIRAGDTGELVVAVTGVNNVDSNDSGDDWGLDFISVRFADAQGVTTTETAGTDAFAWDVVPFATATGVDLKAQLSSDTPKEGIVEVHDTNDTEDVELLRFTLAAEGSDIEIKDLPINFATSTGGTATTLAHIASTVRLVIGDDEFAESTSGAVPGASGATVTFDNIDFTIEDGEKVTVIVEADVNDLDSSFVAGDKLTASYTASNREVVDAEDETGEDLTSGDKTGTATGKAQEFRASGIKVTYVSSSATSNQNDAADTGTFKIRYRVTAVGDSVYLSSLATSVGLTYSVDKAGTATSADSITGTLVNHDDDDLTTVGNYLIEEDESEEFTLTVTVPNGAVGGAGQFRNSLTGVKWDTDDDATPDNNYTSNLDSLKTDYVFLDAA